MSSNAIGAKVLRIAVVQDKRVVQEKVIERGHSVSVGPAESNDFVIPFEEDSFALFEWRKDHYVLRFGAELQGKIRSSGVAIGLDKLRAEGAKKEEELFIAPLADQDRGKLTLGDSTFLFQFVSPPPVQAATPIEEMNFRPRLLDDYEPAFLASLGVSTALGVVFGLWVSLADPPPPKALHELPDRFVNIILDQPSADTPADEKVESDDGEKVEKKAEKKEDKVAPAAPAEKPKSKRERAQRTEQVNQAKDELAANDAFLSAVIGTMGDSKNGGSISLDAAATGKGSQALDAALNESASNGSSVASTGVRKGSGTGKATDRSIGGPGGVEGGTASADVGGSAPAVKVERKGAVAMGGEIAGDGDVAGIRKVVRKGKGTLRYCYEKRLKENPDLEGRLVIVIDVFDGAIDDVFVETNTTRDDSLAKCAISKVKRWNFDGVEDTEGYKVPLTFTPED